MKIFHFYFLDGCAVDYKFDCGVIGTNENECKNKTCCWKKNTSGQPYCFYQDGEINSAFLFRRNFVDKKVAFFKDNFWLESVGS